MRIKRWEKTSSAADSVLVLLTEEDTQNLPNLSALDEGLREIIAALVSRKDFSGKKGSLLRVPMVEGNLYLCGLGKTGKLKPAVVRDCLTPSLRTIGRQHNKSVRVILGSSETEKYFTVTLGEAVGLCGYVFDKYKTKGEDYEPFALEEVLTENYEPEEFAKGQVLAASQIFSRQTANEPGCAVCPQTMAEKAQSLAEECGLECEVWDEERLKTEKAGALLAVGSGSKNPPRLIHLTYKPENPVCRVALVGKGITFDSGGLDIKPSSFMRTMKGDKTGACNVLGVMRGAASLGLNVEVHGILSCAENMPSGTACRPDDIITARNGKTIEIDNTDAEGRLVLADALCVASELKPDVIIDMATLTGACMVALGKYRAGLFSNDEGLAAKILEASDLSGEPLWRLPLEDEHISETLKSPCADLVNSGERYGGAIFAALFLKEFVGEGIAWAHMDIAGPDSTDKEYGVYSKGMTAFGVRTCLEYLLGL